MSDTSRISEVMVDMEFENDSSENGDVSSVIVGPSNLSFFLGDL
jgi:hypothetical protein